MAIRNIKLTICYDGSAYHGWQVQPAHDTIQQQIINALYNLTGQKIKVTGSSRTDAGVSALGQVASFFIDSPIPTENFARALNSWLPRDIAIASAVEADKSFNAIGSTKNKHYRYTLCMSKIPPVLKITQCWHYGYDLDAGQMDAAAKLFIGEKDFKSFASASDERKSSVRTVTRCEVSACGDEIYLDIEGNGFLYNMVRNIMGTLVEVGRTRWTPEKITEILKAKDRREAAKLAPAAGLCLMRIDY
jgi:tRNA pseudouridine38-40 synthase